MNKWVALRGDAEGGPRLRGKERASSHSIQIAQQNRSTGEPTSDTASAVRLGRGELYSVLPPDEHAIWQSEVKRKVVAGGVP